MTKISRCKQRPSGHAFLKKIFLILMILLLSMLFLGCENLAPNLDAADEGSSIVSASESTDVKSGIATAAASKGSKSAATSNPAKASEKAPSSTPKATSRASTPLPSESPSPKPGRLSGIRIGLDPGHQQKANHDKEPNGPDSSTMKAKVASGTYGRFTGTEEYKINLIVGLLLEEKLLAEGAEVFMTRHVNDVDISNRERAEMMNDLEVDLVLRIHCDGNNKKSVHGSSMLVPKGEDCKPIEDASRAYGEIIHQAFLKKTGVNDRGVRGRDDQTGFNWSTRPVCTIEMAFMTNEEEDHLLNDPDFQELCAQGLFDGIVNCFAE